MLFRSTAAAATGGLRLRANEERRGGAARELLRRHVVGRTNRVAALDVDQRRDSGVARSKASWSAFSDRSASACDTMQVMRISEVEIIWMFTLASASVPNIRAA